MYKKIMMAGLCFALSWHGYGENLIVKFKDAKIDEHQQLPVEKRGYVMSRGKDGVVVDFQKYVKDKTSSWPYVGVRGGELKVRDWTPYKYLMIRIQNHSKEISPTVTVVVRDTSDKLHTVPCWIRANSLNHLVIPVAEFGKKVDLKKVNLLQVAMPNSPNQVPLELIDATLKGKAGETNPDTLIPKVHDLKKELFDRNAGVSTSGTTALENSGNDVIVSTQKYVLGHDKWPGVNIKTRVNNTFLDGDFSTKTHLFAVLEPVRGQTSSLGLSFQDSKKQKFWNGIGSIAKNNPIVIDRIIYDMGVDLDDIDRFGIGCTMPQFDSAYRIKTLRLEFRPETLYAPAAARLDALSKMSLNAQEKKESDAMRKTLNTAYSLVKGEQAKYGDVKKFIALTEKTKIVANKLMRSNIERTVKTAMPKGYDYAVGVADSMTSVFLTDTGFRMKPAQKVFLEMAKNEYESFQTVVLSPKPLEGVTVSVSELKGPGGSVLNTESAVVGHSKTSRPQYPVEHVGWYPEFVIDYQKAAKIAKDEPTPFWIRLHTPANTQAGLYKGTVTVSGKGVKSYSFPLEVKVFDFALPDGAPLPSSYNAAGYLHTFYRTKDVPTTEALHKKFALLAARYKLYYDRLYSGPYGTPNYVSDNWKMLHDSGELNSYCIVNATPHPSFTKDVSNPKDPGVERLLRDLKTHMDKIVPIAKAGGFYNKAYIYGFDEWLIDDVTNRVFAYVKKNWPDLPVMTTAAIPNADIPGLENIDIWVPIAKRYANNPELVAALRKRGMKVWWYLCNFPRPPEASLMLDVPGLDPRIFMGMMTWKYQPEGFLYWGLLTWQEKHRAKGPIQEGPRTHWDPATYRTDNGEGNLFVPGRDQNVLPTIRAENFRDGVEDHWYFVLLDRLMKQKGAKAPASLLQEARAALEVPESVVKNTSDYTKDPEVLRAERRKIALLVEKFNRL